MNPKPDVSTPESVERRLGPELKRLREESGLSVRSLADRAGFSASFISQLENGLVSPSIGSLSKIAATLNVSLGELFADRDASEVVVVRANARPNSRSSWSRARVESLTPAGKNQRLNAMMVTIEPGGSTGKHPSDLAIGQLAVVFSGQLRLTVSDQTLDLQTGDAVLMRVGMPHRWENPQSDAAQVLLVTSHSDVPPA